MKNIFDEVNLGDLKLKNRLIRSATWLGACDYDGNLTEPVYKTYRELASGGIGTIVTGITTISPHDALIDGIAQFYDDKFIPQHKILTEEVHKFGAKIFLQAAIVDSVFYIGEELYRVPINQLTDENIAEVVKLFADSAIRAKKSGYDGLQIHAAHGFFLSQYIQRDEKILGDILEAIHEVDKDFCVIAKINGENCIEACKIMATHDVKAIEISGNYTSRDATPFSNEAYFKNFALAVKNRVDVPIILVGGHRSVEMMDKLLNETEIEYLSLSRPLIREPNLINRWKSGDLRPSACISCNSCYRTPNHTCIFNLRRKN